MCDVGAGAELPTCSAAASDARGVATGRGIGCDTLAGADATEAEGAIAGATVAADAVAGAGTSRAVVAAMDGAGARAGTGARAIAGPGIVEGDIATALR